MPKNKIIIEYLKGIKKLDFEIPNGGVHVLTASNGSGKTTLLVCLERLKNTRAFNENFKQHRSWQVDSYDSAKITYTAKNNTSVSYTYRSASDSWRPLTRGSSVIQNFGYEEIIAIPTLGQRIYVQNQSIRQGTVRAASEELRTAMSSVLEDEKFNDLRKINIGETRGRLGGERRSVTAFVLPSKTVRRGESRIRTYFSESSFSLGEIFTLNLLYQLKDIRNNSLLIIDELEVALHPKVQINLLRYLEAKAREKNLTVIVSTHSSSLIKCSQNLIYLSKANDGINVHYSCYPALALKEVAVEEDLQPDFVFFVEDKSAAGILREMILLYLQNNPTRHKPLWKIMPIGGYPEVLNFTKNSYNYLLPRNIGQFAFLDGDVRSVLNDLRVKGNGRTNAENNLWNLFLELNDKIRYIQITPEQGVWEWIRDDTANASSIINLRFPDTVLNLAALIRGCNQHFPNVAANVREDAKNRLNWLITQISTQSNEDYNRVKQHLLSSYCENYYSNQDNRNSLNQLFGPIFRHQNN